MLKNHERGFLNLLFYSFYFFFCAEFLLRRNCRLFEKLIVKKNNNNVGFLSSRLIFATQCLNIESVTFDPLYFLSRFFL